MLAQPHVSFFRTATLSLLQKGQFIVLTLFYFPSIFISPSTVFFSSSSSQSHRLSSCICYYGNQLSAAVGKSGIGFSFTTEIPLGSEAYKL